MPVFFFLSGLLVTQSLVQSRSRLSFLWKRFLRLYPAAWFVILVTALIIGPLTTTLAPADYFSHPLFFRYLQTTLLFRVYFYLPGVFTHSPIHPSVNSPLWSLALELKLYLALFLLSFLGRKNAFLVAVWTLTLVLAAGNILNFIPQVYVQLPVYFGIGALTYCYRNHIVIRNAWLPILFLASMLALRLPHLELSLFLILPAIVLYLAVNGARTLQPLNLWPDLSYGIYIWAFPIEQLIINYIHPNHRITLLALDLLLVLPPAMFSRYFIESKALTLKSWPDTKTKRPFRHPEQPKI